MTFFSHADWLRLAARAAGGLQAAGVRAGRVVALRVDPGPDAAALLAALWHLGAVAAPLSTRLPPAVVPGLLATVGAHLLVTAEKVDVEVPRLDPAALLRAAPLALPPWHALDLARPATLVFTSGSTGTPKAALHTLGNHVWNARGANENIPLGTADYWLLTLPLYHVGGLGILFRALEARAGLAFGPADGVLAPGVTHASLVAAQLHRLMEGGRVPHPPTLKALLLGGSALPPALVDAALAAGLPVHTSYGLTEMASQVATTPPGAGRDVLRSSGRVLPYRELRIGDGGEIEVRGATRFAGYRDAGGLTLPFSDGGWYATGDLGHLDADGLLHVAGRRDLLFISGGENVQPEEVERALAACGVAQSVVVPVPDRIFGQRPVAFVAPGALAGVDALRAALADMLPRFKIPVAFFALPDLAGLKPDRRALAREAARRLG